MEPARLPRLDPVPVPLPPDLPLHAERAGSGDPVILMHGFGASRFTWRFWVDELARRHTLYLVDLRGCGAAARPRGVRYGPDEMAGDVIRLILELDLRRLTLMGHSMGGGIALLITLRLQEAGEGWRIRRIVSVAGTGYAQAFPKYVALLRTPGTRFLLRLVPTGWLVRKVLESILYDPSTVTDAQVQGYAAPLMSGDARRTIVAAAAQLVPEDLDDLVARYPDIDVPTLLLYGRHDPVVPLEIGERLARELPNARLVVLEHCGHMPAEEHPEASLRVVREFLEEE